MKRYDMFAVNDGHDLQECAEGEWVRFEDHEQELIETAGELEKARADVLTFTSRALLSEAALTEATALLAEVQGGNRGGALLRIGAFLSRAPAQPAAPAAPEPSVCARFSGCEGSGYATILGTGGDAAPCEECKLGKVYKRAESAEAQLAMVTAERNGNRDTLKAANDLSEEWERSYRCECLAHAETRAALEALNADYGTLLGESNAHETALESTRTELASWRRTAEKLESRVKVVEKLCQDADELGHPDVDAADVLEALRG